jgi:hypothetical protein
LSCLSLTDLSSLSGLNCSTISKGIAKHAQHSAGDVKQSTQLILTHERRLGLLLLRRQADREGDEEDESEYL